MRIHSYRTESIGGRPYVFVVVTLPEWAPVRRIEQSFPEGDEPDTENRPPSEVLPLLEARAKRAWIDSAREEKAKAHEWCRERMARLDALWAEQRINSIQAEIERLQKTAAKLRNEYLEVAECGECGELGPDAGAQTSAELAHESKFHKLGCSVLDALKAQVGV